MFNERWSYRSAKGWRDVGPQDTAFVQNHVGIFHENRTFCLTGARFKVSSWPFLSMKSGLYKPLIYFSHFGAVRVTTEFHFHRCTRSTPWLFVLLASASASVQVPLKALLHCAM